jgi:hypothetical protein
VAPTRRPHALDSSPGRRHTHHTAEEAGFAYLALGLYADSVDGARYIEFQLADDEDRDWGYCIVDSPPRPIEPSDLLALAHTLASHATLYGGLLAARFSGHHLVLTFDDQAQSTFKWPPVLTLRLDISDEDRSALRTSLPEVLAVGPDGKVPAIAL